jgi:hypothetical protein
MTPGSTTPAANFATGTPGLVDTAGKLPLVSMTLLVNLPPVSKSPAANDGNSIRLLKP